MENASSSNVEIFNECVGLLFGKLYMAFPKRITVSYNDLTFEMSEENEDRAVYFEKHSMFSETMHWLEKAGYIWTDKVDEWEASNVVLTPKGLEVLKSIPVSISNKSIGDELLNAIKSGAKETAKSLISSVVSIALTEGYKMLSR